MKIQNNTNVVNTIKQLAGYLSTDKLKYGNITIYLKTWFVRRMKDNPGCLEISSPILHEGPTQKKQRRSKHSGTNFRSCTDTTVCEIEPIILDNKQLELKEVIGRGRSGNVCNGFYKGKELIFKICDISKYPEYKDEIANEVKVYKNSKGFLFQN